VPEGIEIELYRRTSEAAVGRRIEHVDAPDAWFLKRGLTAPALEPALVGRDVVAARRRGKLLLLDTSGPGPVLGLRFGMTGRLVVDGRQGIRELEYGSERDLPSWDRFALTFAGGGQLRINDPRRLGGVELDPDEAAIGVDASAITLATLRRALSGSTVALKARLMDQSRIAGIGNLLADEILWRAGLDPARPAGGLDDVEVRRLSRTIRTVWDELLERGGSHLGRLQASRIPGGTCPRDGEPLERRTIGGRTTYSCPRHQH
jgi:formamidopyrimidine-DNA glycosylase